MMLLGCVEGRPLMRRALRFVPPAVLSALIFPELLLPGGTLDLSPGNPRLLAGALAALIAWRTKNMLLAIAVGMMALWALQVVFPR
jgi:branched-subunit amino acid transport protein